MRQFPGKIVDIIENSGLNLNNISKASGISNAYLSKLVKRRINRPGKAKVASIMLVLNHTISEINTILADYDYQPLHEDDIPALIEINRQRKIEGGHLPQYDHIYFDLLLVALERIGGAKVLVKNRPSGIFMPSKLYLMKEYPYSVESDDQSARFRYRLTAALIKERKNLFIENCNAGNRLETFICTRCFADYLNRHIAPEARKSDPYRADLVVQYIANALSLALKRPTIHRMRFMNRCSYFHFLIQDADGKKPKVSYPGRKMHNFNNTYDRRILEGFTTDLPHMVMHFKNEIEMCRHAIVPSLDSAPPQVVSDYVMDLFNQNGMAQPLKKALSELMDSKELLFF